jgi:hypothetical protein
MYPLPASGLTDVADIASLCADLAEEEKGSDPNFL